MAKKEPKLTITYMPVEELVPYAGNAKRHPREQVDQIALSIGEFGNCDPIAVWHDNDGKALIVEGHGRVLALNQLGAETAPVISLDHLSDAQRRAYAHIHNQMTLNSGFDLDILEAELGELPEFDWDEYGFDTLALYDISDGERPSIEETEEEKEIIDAYTEEAEGDLKSYNVIIGCMSDEEMEGIKRLLGIPEDERLRRFYRAEELL